jgi:hypothetical protein
VNLGNIKTGVYKFGFTSDDPVVDWANDAYREFLDAFEWPWATIPLLTGSIWAANTPNVEQGALAYQTIRSIGMQPPGAAATDDFIPLRYVGIAEFEQTALNPLTPGFPEIFTVYGSTDKPPVSTVSVYPVPTSNLNYSIGLTNIPLPLSADADVPIIPTLYHYALVRGAAAVGLESDNQEERANTQRQRFMETIDKAIMKYSPGKHGTKFSTVRNTAGY